MQVGVYSTTHIVLCAYTNIHEEAVEGLEQDHLGEERFKTASVEKI